MVRSILVTSALALATVFWGCSSTKAINDSGQKLIVYRPANQTIHQGDKDEVDIRVAREDFDDALTVSVTDLPDGVKVLNENMTIERHEGKFTLTLMAETDAPVVKDHIVYVRVSANNGLGAQESFRISVEANK